MLKHYHDNPEHQRNISPEDKEPDQYTINRIIDHGTTKDGKQYYLVQQKGYDEGEDTWEPADNIEQDAPEAVEDYEDMLADQKEIVTISYV